MTKLLQAFKAEYSAYVKKSATATPQRPWHFQPGALFGRLDAFEERCRCTPVMLGGCFAQALSLCADLTAQAVCEGQLVPF